MNFLPSQPARLPLAEAFRHIRQQTLELCAPLQTEDYVVQPVLDVSPPKWHMGHTTWFFENFILVPHLPGYKPFDLQLNWFFNSYYESQGPRIHRSLRGNMTRPSVETILAYRKYVDDVLGEWLDKGMPSDQEELVEVGLQHEQQHQELLLTDIKYILGHNPLFPAYDVQKEEQGVNSGPLDDPFLELTEGLYEIGRDGEGFCWDNERPSHKIYLQAFGIQNRLVTNGEYLEFMTDGGYEHFEHWLSDGWEWMKTLEEKAPLYWHRQDGHWFHYTLSGLKPVQEDAPVTHVSFYEADAFARWKGLRLPTEQEWEVAAQKFASQLSPMANLMESGLYHPAPRQDRHDSQFWGHVWEWTNSAYLPYPNYPRWKGALGEYNGKFMINQMVLRGGSCVTPASHIRLTYRNFFQPEKRWQFTGIRLAR